MKALIIGKTGQVSIALQETLPLFGFTVSVLGRPELDLQNISNLTVFLSEFISKNIPNIIINAAAYTFVEKAEDEPELAFTINAAAPEVLAKICATHKITLIHFSTDYVFDGTKAEAYVETDQVNPLNVYGASKLSGEQNIALHSPQHLIFRTSWVCSPTGANFMNTMLKLAKTQNILNVVNDQFGAPTFAHDIAHATAKIALHMLTTPENRSHYGIFHLTNSGETSWAGFANAIFQEANLQVQVNGIPASKYATKAKRPYNSRLNCMKLQNVFGVKMPTWQEALKLNITQL